MSDPKPPMPPSRALVLNVMLSILASVFVFVALSMKIVIPQMVAQEAEIRELRAQIEQINAHIDAEEEEEEAEAAAAPAAAPAAAAPAAAAAAAVPATGAAAAPAKAAAPAAPAAKK